MYYFDRPPEDLDVGRARRWCSYYINTEPILNILVSVCGQNDQISNINKLHCRCVYLNCRSVCQLHKTIFHILQKLINLLWRFKVHLANQINCQCCKITVCYMFLVQVSLFQQLHYTDTRSNTYHFIGFSVSSCIENNNCGHF